MIATLIVFDCTPVAYLKSPPRGTAARAGQRARLLGQWSPEGILPARPARSHAIAVTGDRHDRIGELYGRALACSPAERDALRAAECGDDPALRAVVEALLSADAAHVRLEAPPRPASKRCPVCDAAFPTGHLYCPDDGTPLVEAPEALVGATLDGIYRVEALLGRGGMGVVYKARHLLLRDTVAIKILPADVCDDPVRLQRLQREGQAARRFRHPNAVTVYDLRASGSGPAYLVLEYVDGRTLREEMDARGRLTAEETAALLEPVASVLDAAHASGVVHRDLKPENVMVARDERGRATVKVLDLGIAKLREHGDERGLSQQLTDGSVLGTPLYMSPEQWGEPPRDAGSELDGRADVYSLGVMAYEIVTGIHPFKDETRVKIWRRHCLFLPPPAHRVGRDVPEAFGGAIARAIAKDRGDRYPTAGEFVANLRASVDAARIAETPGAARTPSHPGGITVAQAPREMRVTAGGTDAPNNLPHPVTSFVGRERETADVVALLSDSRLLTLTGAGGVGKTRLAIRAASAALGDFPAGVWFVALAPLGDPSLVPGAVAAALEVRERPGESIRAAIVEALGTGRSLLVLDNCEHLVDACAEIASTLLGACAELTVLATSREPLGISGEAVWRVPPLAVPSVDAPAPATLAREAAVALFADRARLAKPGFRLTERNVGAVASVCRRLDGIPLAIELAAARVRVLAPEQILARLDDMFYLLTGGARDTLPHQQTLRGTMDWSHSLLSEEQRVLFRRLAVFAGGFDLEAAEAVAGHGGWEMGDGTRRPGALSGSDAESPAPAPQPLAPVFDVLAQLVDRSLVLADESGSGVRYGMLEPVRQYASELLERSGDESRLRRAHRDWYLDFADRLTKEVYGPRRREICATIELEHDNMRAALAWTLREAREAESGLRFVVALGRFWHARGYFREGLEWVDEAIAVGGDAPVPLHAHALSHRSHLAFDLADLDGAIAAIERSIALLAETDDRKGLAVERNHLAGLTFVAGDYERARTIQEENLHLCRDLGLEAATLRGIYNLGLLDMASGDFGPSARRIEEARAGMLRLGNEQMAHALTGLLGEIARLAGDPETASRYFEECASAFAEQGDRRLPAFVYDGLARMCVDRGEFDRVGEILHEAFDIYREVGDRVGIVSFVETYALAAAARGDAGRAACLAAAAAEARRCMRTPPLPVYRAEIERRLAVAGGDPAEIETARARGLTLSLDAAADYARAER
jgi:non-specific serine/threonine protein kinase